MHCMLQVSSKGNQGLQRQVQVAKTAEGPSYKQDLCTFLMVMVILLFYVQPLCTPAWNGLRQLCYVICCEPLHMAYEYGFKMVMHDD